MSMPQGGWPGFLQHRKDRTLGGGGEGVAATLGDTKDSGSGCKRDAGGGGQKELRALGDLDWLTGRLRYQE